MNLAFPPILQAAIRRALEAGLPHYNAADTEMLLCSVAKAYGSAETFDDVLDGGARRVVTLARWTPHLNAKRSAQLLWAFAKIGYQSQAVEDAVSALCGIIVKEVCASVPRSHRSQRARL